MKMTTTLIAFLLLALTSCNSTTSGTPVFKAPLAVLPFENLTSNPNAGLIVSSDLANALTANNEVDLLSPEKVREVLSPYEGQYLQPANIGESLGAGTVITGTVTEYRYIYGAGEQPSISLSLRAIDTATGKTVWSKQLSNSGNFSWLKEENIGNLSRSIAKNIAQSIRTTNGGM